MPLNPSLFPSEYSNLCPGSLVSEGDRYDELERKLLILRYQMLSGQKKDGQSIAELQNAGLTISAGLFPSLDTAAAYLGGGGTRGMLSTGQSQIDKFSFSNEALTSITARLSVPRIRHASVSGSAKGYWLGGENPVYTKRNDIDALTFATESTATLGATLGVTTAYCRGVNSITKGYLGGNFTFVANPSFNPANGTGVVQTLTFATEATATLGSSLPQIIGASGAVQSSTKGYWAGGNNTFNINAVTFSSDALANLSATLTSFTSYRVGPAGMWSKSKGYFMSGAPGYRGTDALTFATDAVVNVGTALAIVGDWNLEAASSLRKGYTWGAGFWINAGLRDFSALEFSNEVVYAISTLLLRPGRSLVPTYRP